VLSSQIPDLLQEGSLGSVLVRKFRLEECESSPAPVVTRPGEP
jgi:hypothetical protein